MAKKTEDKTEDETEDDFTSEQLDKLGKIINAAVASHSQRKLPSMIKEAVTAAFAEVKPTGGAGDPPKGEGGGQQQGGGAGPSETEKRLTAQIEDLKKALKTVTDDASKRTKAADDAKRDADLQAALTAVGVDKNRMKGALAVVREAVKIGEDGSLKYTAKREGYEDELEVAAGIKEWAGTDEGKAYLAAPGGQQQRPGGSGQQPRRGASRVINGGGAQQQTAQQAGQAKAERKAAAQAKLAEQVGALLNNGGTVDIGG
jgi:hypothetical protein